MAFYLVKVALLPSTTSLPLTLLQNFTSSIFSLELDDKYSILFCMCSSLLYLISEIQWAKINMSFNV